ncbi:MAG TPA: GGDEF domain-containing protein [Anaerolineales bacterium]|nr:GGDEF domain-containing protein [Anaerolineales bacterium]
MTLNEAVKKVSKPVWIGLGAILLGGVAFLDYKTGVELSFSFFYLLPIALIAWTVGERFGLVVAVLSSIIWVVVDVWSGTRFLNGFIYVWNSIVRLGFFSLPVFMIRLNRAMERERFWARTDFLTGALNTRFFRELSQMEINRSVRYKRPFTIGFIDVDNFKTINDTFGHTTGDTVLRTIATNIKSHLRKTDFVARVGGDEFAVLLPETNLQTAPIVISNMQRALVNEMQESGWPVTFSIGVLTLNAAQLSVDDMLGRADQLMYMVKNGGKNNIQYAAYPAEESFAVKIGP